MTRYHREIRVIKEYIDSLGSKVVETDCGSIEYARIGKGYPVLAVHGNAGGFDQGVLLAEQTIDTGFQIVAVSRFGYLHSSMPPDASVAMQADAYVCLLNSLNIKKAAIVGYSAGSASAIQFVLRHPERASSLVLVSPAAPGKGPIMSKPIFNIFFRNDFIYWATITYFGSWVQNDWVGLPKGFILTPEYEAKVKDLLFHLLPVSERIEGSLFDIYTSSPEIFNSSKNVNYPFENIIIPTLVISARDDPLALHKNANTLVERIPNSRLLALPDGGHLFLGHDKEVMVEITNFLDINMTK
ncbi:MAG TPA: alpha/beta hydrolase [Methanobacterium sp.]|jgi:pimeloyl-ACP methyl ester carboxylesterase|nr:MAG: alpha/beta hydrolase [Methanobacterium sp.]HOI39855.1 alpha/beta hydrolase [Methanobacterium sp.]HOI70997.1 alpha/beta hydrolase [Methanobacterium sp.]